MGKHWTILHIALVTWITLWSSSALGAGNTVTGITITSADPNDICFNDNVKYTVTYKGSDPVQSVSWVFT